MTILYEQYDMNYIAHCPQNIKFSRKCLWFEDFAIKIFDKVKESDSNRE